MPLPKQFDHHTAEQAIYDAWERAGCFKPSGEGEPFCVVIPPPNVTGSLHMGHALNNTLQDILIRFERMRGKDVLWQVGTDHAGIATQMVVEREMAKAGEKRSDLSREAFIERVWAWKADYGGRIQRQLKRLGASADWSRERFTMDEGLSAAVRKVFVSLYEEGLIYRDKRLVNWDPKLLTAISDLEVEQREVKGHLWHIDYPLSDGSGHITVATTRPETMLGDTGVAVHPEDERYKDLVGKTVRLPITGRDVPIVADEHADPEKGSGAVKITPAHDFNDFEVGKRAGLPSIVMLTFDAKIVDEDWVPEAYRGLDRFEARKLIVAALGDEGRLRQIEEQDMVQPYGDRSGVVIEPMLTDQWYVDAKKLSGPAIEAVRDGRTRFVPENWTKTYYQWMENIEPWCISRQLWWGHRVPVWYGPDGQAFCAEDEEGAQRKAREHYGEDRPLTQDTDVLDTWFSSALWPFSTLGWPEETSELQRFYPTAVLSTAFDIIFFWVARMMMMGLHFRGEVPFRDVYIHAIVRDEHGQKMSKTKGNVIDPLDWMEKYGTDALRFCLASQATQGRDLNLSEQRVEGYRNFRTKIWNAARFVEMNEAAIPAGFDPAALKQPLSRWIAHEATAARRAVTAALEAYRYDDAAQAAYRFTWNVFCDWALELAKPVLNGEDEDAAAEVRAVLAWGLERILVLLHPFMPFVTEELWGATAQREGFLMNAAWAAPDVTDEAAAAAIGGVIDIVSEIRSLRAEMNVPPSAKLPLIALGVSDETRKLLDAQAAAILALGRLDVIRHEETPPKGAAQIVVRGETYALPVADFIDLGAELARLDKEIGKTEAEIAKIDGKLANEKFVSRAPPEVVAEQRERKAEFEETKAKLAAAKARLEAL